MKRTVMGLESAPHLIVLYDGICGLCNRMVQFLLKRDRQDQLQFASLQSDFAKIVLARHGLDAADLDTVQVVEHYDQPNERVLSRSDAILRAGIALGGFWRFAATVGRFLPRGLRDLFYRFVATNRYSVFGKYETCLLPEPNQRKKFLDQ